MKTLLLSGTNVEGILMYCLLEDVNQIKDKDKTMTVEGVQATYGFIKDRIEENKENIRSLLDQLPDEFHQDSGGGSSFLKACEDKYGHIWTGEHRIMEALFCLGLAVGLVELLTPKEMIKIVPGGMPYYMVKSEVRDAVAA